jgi:type 2 lantibiotic biosynthesis protein LanM
MTFDRPAARDALLEALTLRERTKLLRTSSANAAGQLEEAERELLWPMYRELRQAKKWQLRLEALAIEDADFWRCLSTDALDSAQTAVVLRDEMALFDAIAAQSGPPATPAGYHPGLPLLPRVLEALAVEAFEPLLEKARASAPSVVGTEVIKRDLLYPLLRRLQFMVAPCSVNELSIAAHHGELSGDSPEARFRAFIAQCATPEWTARFFAHYPVLLRRAVRYAKTRAAAAVRMVQRLGDDVDKLEEHFGLDARRGVAHIEGPLGDPHRNGEGVFIVTLDAGGRVVYKPRSLTVDTTFQSILAWLGKRVSNAHNPVRILDCDSHGWVEYIETAECTSENQVANFYRRQGSHLALLYLLGGKDFYFDNIRANADSPHLIDVECLVSPVLPEMNAVLFTSAGRKYLAESVLSIGLLPDWSWGNGVDIGINISGLAIIDGQLLPMLLPAWENFGRDDLRLVTCEQKLQSSHQHLPHLDGRPVPLNDYLQSLIDGFRSTYDLLEAEREAILSRDGPFSPLAAAPVRIVLRTTNDYARLLQELNHPDYLRDGVDFDQLLERLYTSFAPRYPAPVIQSEINQLRDLDVPFFATRGDSRSLWDGQGNLIRDGFFSESAMDGISRRLGVFSAEDRERQVAIIEKSLMLLQPPPVDSSSPLVRVGLLAERMPSDTVEVAELRGLLVAEAACMADRLLAAAVEDDATLTWVDLTADYWGHFRQGSLDLGTYDGAEGISQFLLYLGALTGNPHYTAAGRKIVIGTALQGLHTLRTERTRAHQWIRVFPSLMTFPASSLFLLMHAEHCMGERFLSEEVLDPALDWFEHAFRCVPRYDFLSGAAGIVHLLLQLSHRYDSSRALELAVKHADLVRRGAVARPRGGLGWRETFFDDCLGGFAHGSSGIAAPLLALAARTSDEAMRDTALEALAYEESLFDDESKDWLDMRWPERNAPSPYAGWCHGAGGIALALLLCRPYLPDRRRHIDERITAAMARLRRNEWDRSDCLCHGNFGNLDIMLIASQALDEPTLIDFAYDRLAHVWDQSRRRGVWRCGFIGQNIALPGIHMGLAGIGYGLLRMARPDNVPSILSMDAPPDVTRSPIGPPLHALAAAH